MTCMYLSDLASISLSLSQVAEMASDRKESDAMIAALKARLQEAKDQQKLLVTYPDLNGPVNVVDDVSSSEPASSSLAYDSEANDNEVRFCPFLAAVFFVVSCRPLSLSLYFVYRVNVMA